MKKIFSGKRKGQEVFSDKEEVFGGLQMIPLALALVVSLAILGVLILFAAKTNELRSGRMLASTIGGALTALASNPAIGTYCVRLPGSAGYDIQINSLEEGRRKAYVAVWSPDLKTAGLMFIPVSDMVPQSIDVYKRQSNTLVLRKMKPSDVENTWGEAMAYAYWIGVNTSQMNLIRAEAVEGSIENSHCEDASYSKTTAKRITLITWGIAFAGAPEPPSIDDRINEYKQGCIGDIPLPRNPSPIGSYNAKYNHPVLHAERIVENHPLPTENYTKVWLVVKNIDNFYEYYNPCAECKNGLCLRAGATAENLPVVVNNITITECLPQEAHDIKYTRDLKKNYDPMTMSTYSAISEGTVPVVQHASEFIETKYEKNGICIPRTGLGWFFGFMSCCKVESGPTCTRGTDTLNMVKLSYKQEGYEIRDTCKGTIAAFEAKKAILTGPLNPLGWFLSLFYTMDTITDPALVGPGDLLCNADDSIGGIISQTDAESKTAFYIHANEKKKYVMTDNFMKDYGSKPGWKALRFSGITPMGQCFTWNIDTLGPGDVQIFEYTLNFSLDPSLFVPKDSNGDGVISPLDSAYFGLTEEPDSRVEVDDCQRQQSKHIADGSWVVGEDKDVKGVVSVKIGDAFPELADGPPYPILPVGSRCLCAPVFQGSQDTMMCGPKDGIALPQCCTKFGCEKAGAGGAGGACVAIKQ